MLSVHDLEIRVGARLLMADVSFRVDRGDKIGLVGRNGAGKTTLLRAIMGFAVPRGGTVELAGRSLLAEPSHRRAGLGVGYAPEERVLFPTMTVRDNLRLPCESLGMKPAEIDARIAEVVAVVPQVEGMLPRSAAALSGGQGKMAALARALMVGTRLLMVDEPFQGLAPALARQYAEALSRLYELRPELCLVITESNRALLDRVQCTTLTLERGELAIEASSTPPQKETSHETA